MVPFQITSCRASSCDLPGVIDGNAGAGIPAQVSELGCGAIIPNGITPHGLSGVIDTQTTAVGEFREAIDGGIRHAGDADTEQAQCGDAEKFCFHHHHPTPSN